MLSYKAGQSMKASYDHYGDTDTDNATDQLVDFSKRYPDDPEEMDCPSSVKAPQIPLTSMNAEENKQTYDELKVYYTEGTPSSSSYWDLTQVGVIDQNDETLMPEEQIATEHSFSSNDFHIGIPDTSTKNSIKNSFDVDEIRTFDQPEKGEPNEEEECINQEAEATFTKSSSPLMFSRSSSVGSLNSFEQHSIVDDRSSVSAFSNLASGMISPSEIPDSPFEVASPFISKSKNSEFIFPSNDKSEDPILVDQTNPNGDFADEAYGEDDLKVFDDEGDCPSVSNLSALSIQANSINEPISFIQCKNTLVSFTQRLSVTVNCSVTDGTANFQEECQKIEISRETDVLEQNSINAVGSHSLDDKQGEKTKSIVETKYEDKGTSTSEDFDFPGVGGSYEQNSSPFKDEISKDIKISTPLKNMKEVQNFIAVDEYRGNTYLSQYQDRRQSSDYSKDDSDDESDDLLAQCILNGMPSKDKPVLNESKQSLNHSFQTSGSSLKESFDVPNCSFSDNMSDEDDDDDDGILNECVLLGMPHKSNNIQIKSEESRAHEKSTCSNGATDELPVSNGSNNQLKLFEEMLSPKHTNRESDEKNLNLLPKPASVQRNFVQEEEFSIFNMISQSNNQPCDIKRNLLESDDDSDNDESDLLVQQIVQLGMPKSQSRSRKNTKNVKLPVTYPPNKNLGSRDNCPDGVSDGEDDDDDDILNEIINAGKPNSKSKANKSPYAASGSSLKSQNQRKLTAAEDRQMYLSKYYYGNIPKACGSENSLIGVDDSMYVYRTEDTPLLSPTASLSDLSTLSFTEDKVCQESFLNNSRNSDCSSDSEDDELLMQCIRQGMPGARKVAA